MRVGLILACLLVTAAGALAQTKPRARDLGVPFDGTPGRYNAITDVAGVEVGHTTLVRGNGPLVEGKGPVRTGVTAVLPRGRSVRQPVFAGWFTLNGNGEMTGTAWVEESGLLEGPVLITNTHSVGVVRDAAIRWMLQHQPGLTPIAWRYGIDDTVLDARVRTAEIANWIMHQVLPARAKRGRG